MCRLLLGILFVSLLLFVALPLIPFGPANHLNVEAQTSYPDPAHEHACPSQTGAGGGAEAIPAFVGPGIDIFSPNQSLCLPQLALFPRASARRLS
jgi:hypothetical protein